MGITPRDIKHSQHRRAEWLDYSGVSLYMITLCVEGRHPVFGYLTGKMRASRGSDDFPHLVPSNLGKLIINEELPKLRSYYPQIEIWQVALMPDHLHLLLYICEPLPPGKHLGHLIAGFKGGCSRAWWRITEPAANTTGTTAASVASTPVVPTASASNAVVPSSPIAVVLTASASNAVVPAAQASNAVVPVASASGNSRRPLFEEGYHDRIIKRPGMLENIKRYMSDNPLRAIMRRELPHLLERRLHLRVGTHDYAAFGCLFLLKRAEKEQVFYHRRDRDTGQPTEKTAKFRENYARQLAEARQGVVLVSPSISTPEKLVIDKAIDEGLPVIQLHKEPISQYWKPERRRFEACCRGSLLILVPWGLDEEIAASNAVVPVAQASNAVVPVASASGKPISNYARFHHLNDLAAEICATTDATLLGISELCNGK